MLKALNVDTSGHLPIAFVFQLPNCLAGLTKHFTNTLSLEDTKLGENCCVLGYQAASSGNLLWAFGTTYRSCLHLPGIQNIFDS
jgi:hypothetical protein